MLDPVSELFFWRRRLNLLFLHDEVSLDQDRSIPQLDIPDTVRLCISSIASIVADPLKTFGVYFGGEAALACQVVSGL